MASLQDSVFFSILPRPSLRYDLGYNISAFQAVFSAEGAEYHSPSRSEAKAWAITFRPFRPFPAPKARNIIAQVVAKRKPGL